MAVVLAAPAAAQTAASTQATAAGSESEILVTARRDTERLIDVPASVSVLTAQTLARTGVTKAQDFLQLVPGVTIVTSTAAAGDTQVNIRGINGARDAESSVALVVDGILKTNTAQLNQDQGTLRQIEVLKGPQGAIYGRNATAGAIVMSTVKPGDRFEGSILGSYGSLNTGRVAGYVAGPITDNIGFVLSGNYRSTDGFYRNSFLGNSKTVDNQKSYGVDGRIVAKLDDATTLDLKARYSRTSGASINFNTSFQLPNFAAVNPVFYENVNTHKFNYYSNILPTNTLTDYEFSAKIDHEFDAVKLTAWVQYSDTKEKLTADGTAADFARYITGLPNASSQAASNACFASTAALTGFPVNQPGFIGQIPVPFIFAPANGSTFGAYSPTTCDGTQFQVRNQRDISGEIRLSSNNDGPLSWSLGAYYLNLKREVGVSLGADLGQGITESLYNPPGSSNPTSQLYYDRFKTNAYAVFASTDYKPTDRLTLGVALRYDIESRNDTNLVPFVTDPITGAQINPGQTTGPIAPQQATFRQLEPKITLSYKLLDNMVAYANWGVGFKSGGFNNAGSAAVVTSNFDGPGYAGVLINDRYRKERSSAFEAGVKGSLFDNRISYDLAGYYTQVRDMQFFEFFVGSFGLLRVVSNIDKVDIWGGELNLTARIIDGWTVFGSGNLNGSQIKANASRPYTVGNKSPYTADYTLNLGTQIALPITEHLKGVLRADYRLTGPTWFHTVQTQSIPTIFSALLPISALALPAVVGDANYTPTQRAAYGVVNLRVGLEGTNWTLTAFANNLFDKRYLNEVIPAVEFGGSFVSPGQRRVAGVEASYKF
jgi:iron complex outermembrane receptor protein